MASLVSAASIVVYGKVPDLGWRRGGLAFAGNHVPKPGIIVINGHEMMAENCTYQIRTYENRKAVYVPVGTDYKEAVALLTRRQVTRERQALDARLGIELPKSKLELEAEETDRLAKLAAEEAKREANRKTLLQWVDEYMDKKKNLGVDSVALYRDTIKPFALHCGKRLLEDVTGQDVVDWCHSLSVEGYAQRTIQTRYSTVRGFLQSAGVNLSTLIDESTHRRLSKKPQAETEPYTDEQISRLLAVCPEYYKVAFTLLLATGMRYREANHLTWRQIKWNENKIRVETNMEIHHPKHKGKVIKFNTKNGKSRDVPLFASLKAVLMEWRKKNPNAIFVLGTKNNDLPDNHWLPKLKQFFREAGLNCGVCENCVAKNECEEAYIHRFRHTYAHTCLGNPSISIHQVSKWLGHHNISVTSIYLSGVPKDATVDPFAMELAA